MIGWCSDKLKEQSVKRLLRIVANNAELHRQADDHETTVNSLTQKLDDVNAQLNECCQKLSDSGIARFFHVSIASTYVSGVTRKSNCRHFVLFMGLQDKHCRNCNI